MTHCTGMPPTFPTPLPAIRRLLLRAAALVAFAAPAWAAPADQSSATDQMRADCRAEGEAGGLEGVELEAFVRTCVEDLLTVRIEHIDGR